MQLTIHFFRNIQISWVPYMYQSLSISSVYSYISGRRLCVEGLQSLKKCKSHMQFLFLNQHSLDGLAIRLLSPWLHSKEVEVVWVLSLRQNLYAWPTSPSTEKELRCMQRVLLRLGSALCRTTTFILEISVLSCACFLNIRKYIAEEIPSKGELYLVASKKGSYDIKN